MNETQTNILKKLTPITDAQLGIYEEQLTLALDDSDVKNIALSGPYGAGKSSILATYKRRHPEKKFLHISFAHFQDTAKDTAKDTLTDTQQLPDETRLEGKIINQLIHQLPAEKIPQTHFQLLKEVDRDKIKRYIYWSGLLAVLLAFICFHDAWCRMVDSLSLGSLRSLLGLTTHKEVVLAAAGGCMVLIVHGLTEYICLQRNQRILRKVSLKGTNLDIELFNGENDSYFDRYLNEVLYLFGHVEADAVVFEDIDRYDRNLIFERLREINTLANQIRAQRHCGESDQGIKPLRFLYLIRDDIFNSKDRTKFFDMIIPVVPVMDGSNSYALLLRLFRELEEPARPSDDFLRGVSLYIDDMRLLTNIYNEYLVYYRNYQQSNVIDLNTDKLLAMMVYKNLFPEDHSMLHQGRGYVYTLFHNKEQFIGERKEQLQKEISQLRQKESNIQQEMFQDINELDAAYYMENRRTRIKATKKEDVTFGSRAEYIAEIKANSYEIQYYYEDYYHQGQWRDENVKQKFDILAGNPVYLKHKIQIEQKGIVKALQREINSKSELLEQMDFQSLKNILNNDNSDRIFNISYANVLGEKEFFADIKRSSCFPLIPYLIRCGYIDESYRDYMSYYYADGLHVADKVFLRSLMERNYKGANYQLEEPYKVINWMQDNQFEIEECLNYQLLDALLRVNGGHCDIPKEQKKETVDYGGRLDRFLRYIYDNDPLAFLNGYLQHGEVVGDFVDKLNVRYPDECRWLVKNEGIGGMQKRNYVMQTILHFRMGIWDDDELGALTEYIQGNPQILYEDLAVKEYEQFSKVFEEIQVKFDRLVPVNHAETEQEKYSVDYPGLAENKLLQQVYCLQAYDLNIHNVCDILRIFHGSSVDEWHISGLLTKIFKEDTYLKQYVNENMEIFLPLLIESAHDPLWDGEEVVLPILNREDLSRECRKSYISALASYIKISDIRQVADKEFWMPLLDGHILHTTQNLTDYYFLSGKGMDEALVKYINSYPEPIKLSIKDINDIYGDNAVQGFHADFLKCNTLTDEKYSELLSAFPFIYADFSITGISEGKMRLIITNGTLCMNLDNLHYMRNNYPKLAVLFARQDIEEYMSLIGANEEEYNEKEFFGVLITNKEVFSKFLADSEEPMERKLKALARGITVWGASWLRSTIKSSKLAGYQELLEGKTATFEETPGNKALLDVFLSKKWIEDYNPDEQDENLYRAQGKVMPEKKKKSRIVVINPSTKRRIKRSSHTPETPDPKL